MGTTRIKVIDLSSEEKQIKTSRKHAEKLTGAAKIKTPEKKKPSDAKAMEGKPGTTDKEAITESQEEKVESTDKTESAEVKTEDTDEKSEKSVVAIKKSSRHHQGKKYQQAKKLIDDKPYNIKDALEILPKTSITRFDPAVEIHLNVADKSIKGNITFPHSFGTNQKKTRYLVFSDEKPITEGTEDEKKAQRKFPSVPSKLSVPSVIIWGDEETIDEIDDGKLKPGRDFDSVISSPKFMPQLAKIAKILGPKSMMPNPKTGTVTEDFEKFLSGKNASGYSYKSDPTAPIVHAKIGKLSQKPSELSENLKTLITAIGPSKIKKATLTSTMGPAVKLEITSL